MDQAGHRRAQRRPTRASAHGQVRGQRARLALAVIAFNLARAAATAAGIRKARWATLRRRIIDIPSRIATTRHLDLHPPAFWPSASAWNLQWDNTTGPLTSVAF
jgi:hypothetical protein